MDPHIGSMNGNINRRDSLKSLNASIGVFSCAFDIGSGRIDQNFIALKVFNEIGRRAQFYYEDLFGTFPIPRANETHADARISILDHARHHSYEVCSNYKK